MGGTLARIPSGIITAILVNVGAILIMKFSLLIRFRSHNKMIVTQLVSVFLVTYYNMGIGIMRGYTRFDDYKVLPALF